MGERSQRVSRRVSQRDVVIADSENSVRELPRRRGVRLVADRLLLLNLLHHIRRYLRVVISTLR